MNAQLCIICQDKNEFGLRECKSGISTLIEYAKVFEHDELRSYLVEKEERKEAVLIHKDCQKNTGNAMRKRKRDGNKSEAGTKQQKLSTRKSIDTFDWKTQCFFCGDVCEKDEKHPDRRTIFSVTFLHYRETILKFCDCRKDDWASEVKRRVLNCFDLVHAEAKYHDDCRKFFTESYQNRENHDQKEDQQTTPSNKILKHYVNG